MKMKIGRMSRNRVVMGYLNGPMKKLKGLMGLLRGQTVVEEPERLRLAC